MIPDKRRHGAGRIWLHDQLFDGETGERTLMAASHELRSAIRPQSDHSATQLPMTPERPARSAAADTVGRRTFVLAIFSDPESAADALQRMAAYGGGRENVLLVTQLAFPGSITTQPIFERIWSNLSERAETTSGGTAPRGNDRLVRDLAHRIANGATLVIATPQNQTEQRSISRALLDTGCEILLTHEVSASGGEATTTCHYSFTT